MLHVHRSERADAIVEPLAGLLSVAPEDPFTPDVVAVPSRGVERWLAQQLSSHLGAGRDGEAGVCANVSFGSPARLVADALAAASGIDPRVDPWHPDRLVWPLLETVDECAGEPWCSALGRHLGVVRPDGEEAGRDERDGEARDGGARDGGETEQRRGRRLAVARHLASLFGSYAVQRPAMLRAWAARDDSDGAGSPVPEDLCWQPPLWRRLRERVGAPGPAERLPQALDAIRRDPAVVPDLPQRLSVVGPTRLPQDQLGVLAALAAHRDVHLWLLHPSPVLWRRTAGGEPAGTAPGGRGVAAPGGVRRRRELVRLARSPLLASMARDATELGLRLADLPAVEHHHPAPAPPPTLLGALQQRLRDDISDDDTGDDDTGDDDTGDDDTRGDGAGDTDGGGARTRFVLPATDRSVQVHACHGRARQVEVLREVLVGLFADDPGLEPRDVLVMCPDIEAVAPLVTAGFGPADEVADDGRRSGGAVTPAHPGRTLRVRLADRSLRQTNPLLSLLARLLEMADGRVTASEVLDLAGSEPVRRRFGLDDDDLDRVRGWAVEANVRWGEDQRRRARFGLDTVGQGTWQVALDRLLLGVAMAEEDQRFVGTALPLDDVDSTDVDLAGRFTELVDRLGVVLARLDGVQPLPAWLDALDAALDQLAGTAPADAWQQTQARRVVAEARTAAASSPGLPLRLADLRALLADRLAGRPTRAGFRTGALTMCSLVPMRAVPHRVVVLLGMDDGAFPRGAAADGDDVLLRDPLLGERDRRSEDRQLFLDAVTSAREHLVVLYSGADERTGARRPPAVPVGELLDALDAAAAAPGAGRVRDRILVRHPLQGVDGRNFVPSALGRPGPFSFDASAHAAALAGRGDRHAPGEFLPRPLPPPPRQEQLDLDDLVATLEHPVKAFLRRRLGVALVGEADDVDDRLPLELEPLREWAVGDRLLAALLDGTAPHRAPAAERRRGNVPPLQLGTAVLTRVQEKVAPVAAAALLHRSGPARGLDVSVDLPDERVLVGTVPGVHDDVLLRAVYSRLAAKHRLRAWVQLLAVTAAGVPGPRHAVTVGRSPGRSTGRAAGAQRSTLRAPSPAAALHRLQELVRLHDRALREPLPLPVATAAAYARSRAGGDLEVQALEDARRTWASSFECEDDHHVAVWGERPPLQRLLAPATATEQAWWPEEGTRLGVLARRVWQPLLDHERVDAP